MDLGLTILQAKIYTNLVKLQKTDVKTISKVSDVARTDIYRVMPTLETLGLVEKIITNPVMYEAVPIKDGFSILLQKRKEEDAEIEEKTTLFLNNFQDHVPEDFQGENQGFKFISEWALLKKMHLKLIHSVQTRIDFIVAADYFYQALFDHRSCFREAKKRGVKIRAITTTDMKNTSSRKAQFLAKYPITEIRYTSVSTMINMHIFDKNEITLRLSQTNSVPTMWSNNNNFIELAENYFEYLWNKAKSTKKAILANKQASLL